MVGRRSAEPTNSDWAIVGSTESRPTHRRFVGLVQRMAPARAGAIGMFETKLRY
jgi:hypothetical protein